MGINAEQWGKQGWHFIHSIAYNYPDNPTQEDKKNYSDFIHSMQKVLPCPFCAEHFKQNIIKMPIRLYNKSEFFNWTVDMHNEVNKLNGKAILSYEEASDEWVKNAQTKEQLENDLRLKSIQAQSLLRKIKKLNR